MSYFLHIYELLITKRHLFSKSTLDKALPVCFKTITSPYFIQHKTEIGFGLFYQPLYEADEEIENFDIPEKDVMRMCFMYPATMMVNSPHAPSQFIHPTDITPIVSSGRESKCSWVYRMGALGALEVRFVQ